MRQWDLHEPHSRSSLLCLPCGMVGNHQYVTSKLISSVMAVTVIMKKNCEVGGTLSNLIDLSIVFIRKELFCFCHIKEEALIKKVKYL